MDRYFFALGLVNSVCLICVFVMRKNRLALLQRVNRAYLLLAIPAAYGLVLAWRDPLALRHAIFLAIFLAFLFMEWLLDFALKIDFRTNMKRNLKWVIPYLSLYYAANYGFVVMPWRSAAAWGQIMLILFIIQIGANIWSHPWAGR